MTTTAPETDLRYPVGQFDFDAPISKAEHPRLIAEIAETPGALRSAVAGLSRDQLETRYLAPRALGVASALHGRGGLRRGLRHPEHGRVLILEQMLALYAWHGRHHVAHITELRKREGW